MKLERSLLLYRRMLRRELRKKQSRIENQKILQSNRWHKFLEALVDLY